MELQDVKALEAVLKALEPLEAPVKERVLRWASESLGFTAPKRSPRSDQAEVGGAGGASTEPAMELEAFDSVGEVLAASNASTEHERALVVAAFLSRKQGKLDLTGQEINTELRNAGHGIGSINKAIDVLKEKKPQLMLQTKKSGTSKQARKNYRVTSAGYDRVKAMLGAERDNAGGEHSDS